jgi:endonuclease/exonuclease/phosphatase (EEP) superfamily protein YafD
MTLLRNAMTDVYSALGLPDESHCGGRIDYIFVRGSYRPAEYETTCGTGSDHPFVWARLDVE